jgi:hypothetical protein
MKKIISTVTLLLLTACSVTIPNVEKEAKEKDCDTTEIIKNNVVIAKIESKIVSDCVEEPLIKDGIVLKTCINFQEISITNMSSEIIYCDIFTKDKTYNVAQPVESILKKTIKITEPTKFNFNCV